MNETYLSGLVRAAEAGDQKALTELYNLSYNDVYRTALFLVRDEDTALDILQDSYIKAFSGLNTLSDPEKFFPWIKRIAHNMAVDRLRKKTPEVFSAMTENEDDPPPEFRDDRTENLPDASLDQKETARLVREILNSLPDEQRTCITLYYYEEMSVKEIASELGIPEATVKSRLQYGRKKIEAAVRDLEKKGTKLYGMSPVPFFLWLLRNSGVMLEQGASGLALANILQQTAASGAAASSSAASSAASGAKAAGATAVAAKTAVSTKVIAAVLAVLVVGGGVTAVIRHRTKAPAPQEPVPASEQPPATAEEPSVPAQSSDTQGSAPEAPSVTADKAYSELLGTYRDFFNDLASGADVTADPDYAEILTLEEIRFTMDISGDSPVEAPYYAYKDINSDGVDELILAFPEVYENPDYVLWRPFEVYAFDGEKAVPMIQNAGIDIGYYYNIPNIHIMPEINGLGLDYGNGLSPKWFFTLPAGSSSLEQVNYFETGEGLPRHWNGTSGESLTDEELDARYPSSWNYDDHGYRSVADI